MQDRSKQRCRFHFGKSGTCHHGDKCHHSHDTRRHEPAVNPERSNATGQPPQEEINPAVNLAQA